MSNTLLQVLRAGDVDQLRAMLAAEPALARAPLYPAWGCPAEPLLVACNGPFNGWPLGGRAAELAETLLDAGVPVDGDDGQALGNPLISAVSLGNTAVARLLVERGADLEAMAPYPGVPTGTPLDYAGHFGMVCCVDLLAAHGARVNTLRKAAAVGLPDALEPLLSAASAEERRDALRVAVVCDRVGTASALLASGAQIGEASNSGGTFLHWAAWEGKPRMIRWLIGRGADPEARDPKHQLTSAEWAVHRAKEIGPGWGHAEVLRVLEEVSPAT